MELTDNVACMALSVQFSAIICQSNNKLWNRHFFIPDDVIEQFLVSSEMNNHEERRRVVCILNSTIEFQCGLIPFGNAQFVIHINKKICEKLGLEIGSEVLVQLRPDTSKYGLPMPEEFAEVMATDQRGAMLFETLTPGAKRTLLYVAGSVKNSDKRIQRALAILDHLKKNKGKIDFKNLNQELRPKRV